MSMSMREECVYIGYVTERQDKKYYFKSTAENIAKFIMQNYQSNTVITDNGGAIICRSVVGGYLDADNKEVMGDILPILLKYQRGEKFKELVFKGKEEGIYYSEDLNVPVTGTFSEPKEAADNKITDSLIKRKYFLYQCDLTEGRMRILYEELKGSGYSVLKVKNNGLYSLYCRKKQVFEGRRENE